MKRNNLMIRLLMIPLLAATTFAHSQAVEIQGGRWYKGIRNAIGRVGDPLQTQYSL